MLMRSLLTLAWSSLGSRRFAALMTIACIGLGSAALIVVEQVRTQPANLHAQRLRVDLIVGPRGGSVELLMGVVFRTGTPGRGMSFESYRQIAALPGVAWALPSQFGISHHDYPVMGTEADYFEHFRYGRSQPLAFAAGHPFSDVFDTVIGAEIAERLGYQLETSRSPLSMVWKPRWMRSTAIRTNRSALSAYWNAPARRLIVRFMSVWLVSKRCTPTGWVGAHLIHLTGSVPKKPA